jgi:hypothetical protein
MSSTFKLTFNKPAVRQFISKKEHETRGTMAKGLDIHQVGGIAMFRQGDPDDCSVVMLPRTRGGYEAIIEGTQSATLLAALENGDGPFFTLERDPDNKDWVAAKPWPSTEAPPKFEPHVRLWVHDGSHTYVSPLRSKKTKPKAPKAKVKAAPTIPYIDQVRMAYRKLNEPRGPGRPGNDHKQAKAVVAKFETEARKAAIDNKLNVAEMFELYTILGSLFETIDPTGKKRVAVEGVAEAVAKIETHVNVIGKGVRRKERRVPTEEMHAA